MYPLGQLIEKSSGEFLLFPPAFALSIQLAPGGGAHEMKMVVLVGVNKLLPVLQ